MIKSILPGVQLAFIALNRRSTEDHDTLHTTTVAQYGVHMDSRGFRRRGRVCSEGPRLAACPPLRARIRASHSMMHPALRGQSKQPGCTP